MARCLGKHDPKRYAKTLLLKNYQLADTPLPTAPTSCFWSHAVTKPFNAFLNDSIGDCTIADQCHRIMVWSANADGQITPTDDDAMAAYRAVSGYDPTTGANDNGAAIEDVLAYAQNVGIAGHKIDSYAAFNYRDINLLRLAITWFGGVTLGVQLPQSAEQQTAAGQPWTAPWWSLNLGGHDLPLVDYDENYFYAITWGQIQAIDPQFIFSRADEAYSVISPLFLAHANFNRTPYNFLDLDSMRQDAARIAAA